MSRARYLRAAGLVIAFCLACFLSYRVGLRSHGNAQLAPTTPESAMPATAAKKGDRAPTNVSAHNLMLRKGPEFRIYIRWILGQLLRTQANVVPSLDEPESFVLLIEKGVIHANLGDLGIFLNSGVSPTFPLKKVNITGDGDQIKLTGILHKLLVPLPVEVLSTISATPDGRVHLHVTKINVLKIPLKALLGGLHVTINDVMGSSPIPGIEVSANDLFFDTTKLLPPPHIRGQLSSVRLANPDLVLVYGEAAADETRLAQWHNFLKLSGGTLDFGKLTMNDVDLTLIDASNDYWFDLDLVNYQAQLVNGYSRMTPEAGLEIFMPHLDPKTQTKTIQSITLEWLKNRNTALPPDVPVK